MWASGDAYEGYIGRWSRQVAPRFVTQLDAGPGLRWVDVGCGTGALAGAVLEHAAPSGVVAVDRSPAYAGWASRRLDDRRLAVVVGDAARLPVRSADVVVSGLLLNFLPDPAAVVRGMREVATGPVAAYVWDYADGMQLLRRCWDAAAAVDPSSRAADEGVRFPLCRPEALASLWRDAGLTEVETWAVDVPTVFRDVDDLWAPFLGGQGPAGAYVSSLPPARRAALRRRLEQDLPVAPDGSVAMTARAWAVRGRARSRRTRQTSRSAGRRERDETADRR